MKYLAYMVLFDDGYLYTGSTCNLGRRTHDRARKFGAGFKIVFKEAFSRREDALVREKQIKGWSRKKKETLFGGRMGELAGLAARRGGRF